jgi:predicted flap endonuclease-1-like 5' DNA nuclease
MTLTILVVAEKAAATFIGLPWWAWLIIIIVIILLLAYWLNRPKGASAPEHFAESTQRAAPVHIETEAAPVIAAPATAAAQPDDLTRLEGIGPKVNSLLQAAGISTFAQLAVADVDLLKRLLEEAKLRMMDPSTWPEQARLASEGKWEELEELTSGLRGGRRV